ncbi:hypothetical protein [Metabacillus bambusae]|uniref:DUF1798 domain-containing protein n=1 Tax=Metabacillus bambusae TaxID=2795218 RepID=A0ABS3NBL1_9BACI|nr:hypothetical protein [Metabacillus bambusae]MBO1515655.1 hypothetical protein [Metabacillus bambusae]
MKAPISKDQEELIHNFIVRTYLINVLESDLKTIERANFKLNEPYIKLVEHILKKIRIEIRDMKAEMKKLEMKVEEPFLDNVEFWQYDFYVRGYHGFKRYWDYALKMHCTKLLDMYFKGEPTK